MKNTRIVISFKSKNQLPLFMITKEYYNKNGELTFAKVIFEIKGKKYKKLIKEL